MSRTTSQAPRDPKDSSTSLPNIHRVVSIAARRTRIAAALRVTLTAAAIAAGAFLLVILIARTTPALGLPPGSPAWPWLAGAAGIAVIIAAMVAYLAPRAPLADAIEVDQRLQLRDRLGSALALNGHEAPFACAAVRDGEQAASDRALPQRVATAFAVRWPRTWWVAPLLMLAAFMATWLLPQLDLWSRLPGTDAVAMQQARDDATREVEAVVKHIEENPELAQTLAEEIDKAGKELKSEEPKTPEEIRREAMRTLTELAEKLDELVKKEESMALDALKDQLASMKLPDSALAMKLSEALKRGDFEAANLALQGLQEQLRSESLTPEEREALAKALEDMANQLSEAEEAREALEEALRQAGLDPQLAQNAEALKSAIENNKNLTESQREALMKALESQQSCSQMCKQLSQQMNAMASQCKSGQMGEKAGSCGEGLRASLSELAKQQMMMAQAKLAQGACKSGAAGLCLGSGMLSGLSPAGGIGSGGPAGALGPERKTSVGLKEERAHGVQDGADVVAREFIEGSSIVGESRAVMRRIEANAAALAEDDAHEDPIPPHLREAHKHYFGELKKKIDARTTGETAP